MRGLSTIPALLTGSLLAGIGICVVNVLLPGLVKRDFPDQAATMTGGGTPWHYARALLPEPGSPYPWLRPPPVSIRIVYALSDCVCISRRTSYRYGTG